MEHLPQKSVTQPKTSGEVSRNSSIFPYGSDLSMIPSAQAREHFDFFIELIPQRMHVLRARCADELNIEVGVLDYSAESLLPMWQWALRSVCLENASAEIPECNTGIGRFTAATQCMLCDVGTYLGECFVRSSSALEWCHCTRPGDTFCVNQPVIRGFQMPRPGALFCMPLHITNILADKLVVHRESPQDLFDMFRAWYKYVPDR